MTTVNSISRGSNNQSRGSNNQGSNTSNRLDGFSVGLNAARAAMGDSPPQYNTQQSL